MAAIDLSIIGKLEEVIETLTFRDEASVKIRKIKREKAFSQSVDIIIKSISYNLYENFKATPPIQFYGYATLVMQDCTEISIPIVSARQRLYYGFQYEAFRQWRHWIEFYQLYQLHRFNDISLASIMGALEIPYEEKKPQLKQNGWIELPIREVYIKLQDGTQFELEFSQWQPVKFTDPINNVEIDGKSKQDDGDKDSGLPKDGIQPKKNLPSDPFAGNAPASSLESSGIKGFDLVDASLLGESNPNNFEPDPFGTNQDGVSYNVTIDFGVDYVNGSGATVGSSTGQVYFPIVIGKILSISSASPATVFDGDFIGVVSSQIIIVAQNGTLSGLLNNTNINPPFSSQFGANSWRLNGIDGFNIVPN